jgi:Domain of unknown function (DUF397)
MNASTPRWFTSSFSGGNGNGCVEVAFLSDGAVGVRDTKDRTRRPQSYPSVTWRSFLAGVRAGEFDRRRRG